MKYLYIAKYLCKNYLYDQLKLPKVWSPMFTSHQVNLLLLDSSLGCVNKVLAIL